MTVGSLFAGIGGFDLGFERAGFDVIWQCEENEFCTRTLNKHWPNVPVYPDVRTLYTEEGPNPERPDVLIGGFPCQDLSLAGKGAGLDGKRSGLWWEYHRIIGVVRPQYVVVENVPALVNRGLPAVLGALSKIGYDAEWEIVSAAAHGAPHLRERLFVVADAGGTGCKKQHPATVTTGTGQCAGSGDKAKVAYTDKQRHNGCGARPEQAGRGEPANDSGRAGTYWTTEPQPVPLANGVPDRVGRIRGYGNAIVPQVAEYVADCVRQHSLTT